MTVKWTQGTLCIIPENSTERDALLMVWNIKKAYSLHPDPLPIDPKDFGVMANGVDNDTLAIQAGIDALVSL